MLEKKCKIIGYSVFNEKETQEKKIRIVIGVNSISENYIGTMVTIAFLNYSEELIKNLSLSVNNDEIDIYYKTSDNIITGKTKITELIFNFD